MKAIYTLLFSLLVTTLSQAASMLSNEVGNFFLPGQELAFNFELGDTPLPDGGSITFNLHNAAGLLVATHTEKLEGRNNVRVTFAPLASEGFYTLEALAGTEPLASCTLGMLPAAEADAEVNPGSRFGTVAHLKRMGVKDREKMLNLIQRAGFGWVREGFLWHQLEPSPGDWHTEIYDDIVERSLKYGINVLPILCFSAPWAVQNPEDIPKDKLRLGRPETVAWKSYVAKMVDRYGDRLHAWEVWNEPNLDSFWLPEPNPKAYAAVAAEASEVIRAKAPGDTIIAAGLSPCRSYYWPKAPERDEALFVQALAEQQPMAVDALGGHPYTLYNYGVSNRQTEAFFHDNQKALIEGLSENVEESKSFPIWATEMGVSTIPRITTEMEAAGYIAIIMTLAYAEPNIPVMFLYNFRDVGTDPAEKEDMFGLIHYDYTPKPGYFAARTFINKIGGASFQGREETNGIVTHHFLSPEGKRVDILWALDAPVELYVPEGVSSMHNVTGSALPATLADGYLVVEVGANPVYFEF